MIYELKMTSAAVALVLMVTAYSSSARFTKMPDHPCFCAAMNSSDPADKHVERAIHLPLPCDKKGDGDCKKLCIALANSTASDPQGKEKFCKFYGKEGRLYVHVFSKVCNLPYVFTGIANTKPVCCKDKKNISCEQE